MKQDVHPESPSALRLWHWMNSGVVVGLLGTVLLRKTWLSWRTNSSYLQEALSEHDITITPALAKTLAVGLRDPMWAWHYWLGHALIALLIGRALIAMRAPATHTTTKLLRAIRTPVRGDVTRGAWLHQVAIYGSYSLLYLALGAMACTGAAVHNKDALGLTDAALGSVKYAHERLMWFFPLFTAAHVAGVVLSELRERTNLVSRMIHGGAPPPAATPD